jgi:flavin-dependent dehydrogenase
VEASGKQESREYDVIVVGAGPAGSACAITAVRSGARVLLLDKASFPRHKVCGEFVSSESLHIVGSLLRNNEFVERPKINSSRIFLDSRQITIPVDPPASSIPRYDLDAALLVAAKAAGVNVCEEVLVRDVHNSNRQNLQDTHLSAFTVSSSAGTFTARAVVNASGRWSELTQRDALNKRSPEKTKWIGLKAHFRDESAPNSVDLYFFRGGYCGVQPINGSTVNACAMVQANVARSLDEVFVLNPELQRRSRNWQQQFPTVTTSGLRFREPRTDDGGMLLAGDAAAFIDPFAGDGISLALHGGVMAAQALMPFLHQNASITQAHQAYRTAYFRQLAPALRNASRIRKLLSAPAWLRAGIITLAGNRMVGKMLVRETRARG